MIKTPIIVKKLFLPISLIFPFSLINFKCKEDIKDKEFMDNLIKIIQYQRM